MDHHIFKKRSRRQLLTVVAAFAVVFAGCGTSVPVTRTGSSTSAASVTTARSKGTSVTQTTSVTKTTKAASSITVADLEKLLPTAAQVGPDYRVDSSNDGNGDEDVAMSDAMDKACPDAGALLDAQNNDGPTADRSFTTDDSRSVEVQFEPGNSDMSGIGNEAELDKLVAALNSCKTISYTDKDGLHFELTLKAKKDSSFGDIGIVMDMDMMLSGDLLPKEVPFSAHFRIFQQGAVTVTVSASSGLDQATLEAVPADVDVLETLSKKADDDVSRLQGRN